MVRIGVIAELLSSVLSLPNPRFSAASAFLPASLKKRPSEAIPAEPQQKTTCLRIILETCQPVLIIVVCAGLISFSSGLLRRRVSEPVALALSPKTDPGPIRGSTKACSPVLVPRGALLPWHGGGFRDIMFPGFPFHALFIPLAETAAIYLIVEVERFGC